MFWLRRAVAWGRLRCCQLSSSVDFCPVNNNFNNILAGEAGNTLFERKLEGFLPWRMCCVELYVSFYVNWLCLTSRGVATVGVQFNINLLEVYFWIINRLFVEADEAIASCTCRAGALPPPAVWEMLMLLWLSVSLWEGHQSSACKEDVQCCCRASWTSVSWVLSCTADWSCLSLFLQHGRLPNQRWHRLRPRRRTLSPAALLNRRRPHVQVSLAS